MTETRRPLPTLASTVSALTPTHRQAWQDLELDIAKRQGRAVLAGAELTGTANAVGVSEGTEDSSL